jgi:hypothetical protein
MFVLLLPMVVAATLHVNVDITTGAYYIVICRYRCTVAHWC